MRLILQLFILLSFMSFGQNPMSYYAPLNSDLLESIKSATASKDPVYKLSIDNQLIESKDFIKLFRLNQLEALALKRNQLDSLPSGLSQLQKLRYFQSNNPLQTFPIELGNCINLEKIVLINSAIDSIPGNLFLNPSIKHIEIHSNPDSLSIKIPNTGKTSLSSILLFSTPILEIDLNNKVIDINLIKCYINGREPWFKDLNKVKNLDLSYNQISILIHPNSYVHAIIEFKNGLTKVLIHETSMAIPIFNSLYYDENKDISKQYKIDINKLNNLNFSKPNLDKFQSLKFIK